MRSAVLGTGVAMFATAWSRMLLAAEAQAAGAVLLEKFPLHKQETPYTCGPAAARMVLEFLGHPVAEAEIKKRFGTNGLVGTSNGQEVRGLNRYLQEFKTGLTAKMRKGKAVTNEVVMQSLQAKLPVIASFLTENYFKPGTEVGHFAVIIGYDPAGDEFTLANPFGYLVKVNTARFWRLAEWNPQPGDLPPSIEHPKGSPLRLKRTIIVMEKEAGRL